MKYTKTLDTLTLRDIQKCGHKAYALGKLMRAGFNIPNGYVILATAFHEYICNNNLDRSITSVIDKLDTTNNRELQAASNQIINLLSVQPMPYSVIEEMTEQFEVLKLRVAAVRSSAAAEDTPTASLAGGLDSVLCVQKQKLSVVVKKCWESLFTPRAICYLKTKNVQIKKISLAVIVQAMVDGELSGIVFTANPITSNRNQMIVEAGYGLGDTIASGLCTPDTYYVEKPVMRISSVTVNEQKILSVCDKCGTKNILLAATKKNGAQKLSNSRILKLAQICVNIENDSKFPCDIEWSYKHGQFYILQSRPITTL